MGCEISFKPQIQLYGKLKTGVFVMVHEGWSFNLNRTAFPSILIFATAIASLAMLAKIVPYPDTLRYIAPIMPLVFVMVLRCFEVFSRDFSKPGKIFFGICMTLSVIIPVCNPSHFENYRTFGNIEEIRAELDSSPHTVIAISSRRYWSPSNRLFELYRHSAQNYVIHRDDVEFLQKLPAAEKKHVVLWVDGMNKDRDHLRDNAVKLLNGRIIRKLFDYAGPGYLIEALPTTVHGS